MTEHRSTVEKTALRRQASELEVQRCLLPGLELLEGMKSWGGKKEEKKKKKRKNFLTFSDASET